MYVFQLSTDYSHQFAVPTRINVIDESEMSEAEVSIGKNLLTGEWCGSMYFEPWMKEEVSCSHPNVFYPQSDDAQYWECSTCHEGGEL